MSPYHERAKYDADEANRERTEADQTLIQYEIDSHSSAPFTSPTRGVLEQTFASATEETSAVAHERHEQHRVGVERPDPEWARSQFSPRIKCASCGNVDLDGRADRCPFCGADRPADWKPQP